MSKPLEEYLADYLIGLAPGPWKRPYARECLALWRERHGDAFASRVKSLLAKKAGKK